MRRVRGRSSSSSRSGFRRRVLGKALSVRRSLYWLLGWLAWKIGKRLLRRRTHVIGR